MPDARDPGGPDRGHGPPQDPGTVGTTGPAPLVLVGVVGLVVGWSLRLLALRLGYAEPDVSGLSLALLAFVALILGSVAWLTRRAVRRDRTRLAHHAAVNRLVLGKACALVGALLLGGFLGYAVAQLGVGDPAATTRLWRSGLGALGAGAVLATALLLEHACRVPGDPDRSP